MYFLNLAYNLKWIVEYHARRRDSDSEYRFDDNIQKTNIVGIDVMTKCQVFSNQMLCMTKCQATQLEWELDN